MEVAFNTWRYGESKTNYEMNQMHIDEWSSDLYDMVERTNNGDFVTKMEYDYHIFRGTNLAIANSLIPKNYNSSNIDFDQTFIVTAGPSVFGYHQGIGGEYGVELGIAANAKHGMAIGLYQFSPLDVGYGTDNLGIALNINMGWMTSDGEWRGYSWSPLGKALVPFGVSYQVSDYTGFLGSDLYYLGSKHTYQDYYGPFRSISASTDMPGFSGIGAFGN